MRRSRMMTKMQRTIPISTPRPADTQPDLHSCMLIYTSLLALLIAFRSAIDLKKNYFLNCSRYSWTITENDLSCPMHNVLNPQHDITSKLRCYSFIPLNDSNIADLNMAAWNIDTPPSTTSMSCDASSKPFQISSDGFVTLEESPSTRSGTLDYMAINWPNEHYNPRSSGAVDPPLIAPFYAEMDFRIGQPNDPGQLSWRVLERSGAGSSVADGMLDRMSEDVRRASVDAEHFVAQSGVVVTWYNVTFSRATTCSTTNVDTCRVGYSDLLISISISKPTANHKEVVFQLLDQTDQGIYAICIRVKRLRP